MHHLCVTLLFAISSERIEVLLLLFLLLLLQCGNDQNLDIASWSSSYLRTMHLHRVYDDVHDDHRKETQFPNYVRSLRKVLPRINFLGFVGLGFKFSSKRLFAFRIFLTHLIASKIFLQHYQVYYSTILREKKCLDYKVWAASCIVSGTCMHTESGTSGKKNGHILVGVILQTDCPRPCKASGFSGTHTLVVVKRRRGYRETSDECHT